MFSKARIEIHIACALFSLGGVAGSLTAQSETFVNRVSADDVRMVSYNMFFDSWFQWGAGGGVTAIPAMQRIVGALDADIWNLQEVSEVSAADVVTVMNQIAPLAGGSWIGHKSRNQVIVSKFDMSMLTLNVPGGRRGIAMGLVDLPDTSFVNDLYILNNHFPCCEDEAGRQHEADAIVSWMRDATAPGGIVSLPVDTAIAVVGDLNIVGSGQPLDTLITGDIANEFRFGPDGPPDWDDSGLADAHPLHNATLSDDYTWRNDLSFFDPGRLDYVVYTDSVIDVRQSFILNTMAMSPTELALTGLEAPDVMRNMAQPQWGDYDHLPVVVDFAAIVVRPLGDANNDNRVTGADLLAVQANFGQSGVADGSLLGDANDDGQVTGSDLIAVQQHFGDARAPESSAVPEPKTLMLLAGCLGLRRARHADLDRCTSRLPLDRSRRLRS